VLIKVHLLVNELYVWKLSVPNSIQIWQLTAFHPAVQIT